MAYSEKCRQAGTKLEINWWKGGAKKKGCWRKKIDGKQHYFFFPNTRDGYQQALLALAQLKAKLDLDRPNAETWHHHEKMFSKVKLWYEQFGVPPEERRIAKEVSGLLVIIQKQLKEPMLPEKIPFADLVGQKTPFFREFVFPALMVNASVGTNDYQLPEKWQERIRQLDAKANPIKAPQTIGYWFDQYERSQTMRDNITHRSKSGKIFKLAPFRKWIDENRHVTTINDADHRDFFAHVRKSFPNSVETQQTYFGNYKTFLMWMLEQADCEFKTLPLNFNSKQFRFTVSEGHGMRRLKNKRHLWTANDFETVLKKVPQPYRAYCILMLNCGMRQTDLDALKKENVDLKNGRLIYQRHKTVNVLTSPVINYKLWPITLRMIKKAMVPKGEWLFCSRTGKRLIVETERDGKPFTYDVISRYWRRARAEFGLKGKMLSYIRKTGSTVVGKYNRDMDTVYLAESLKAIAKIRYTHEDGEPLPDLDAAIDYLGSQFGFCDPPKQQVELTPEMVKVLQKAGLM